MMKKWKFLVLFLFATITNSEIAAQLSVQGLLHVHEGAELHVWNDVQIISADGLLENNGIIEVEGNWVKDGISQFDGNPSATGERLVVFRNNNFNEMGSQRISGEMTGNNSFFNLEINNTGGLELIELAGDIEIANNLNFLNGRIRTDIQSDPNGDGNAYANTVFISDSNINAITGQTTTASIDRYVEGRLIRAVAGMGTYSFPVGVSPEILDGAEPFEVTFTTPAPISNISSAFQIGTTTSTGETRFCDIGIAPNFSIPDGVLDELEIDCVAGQWVTESDEANYNFDIAFQVGSVFRTTCNDAALFYVANNGNFEDCPDFSGSSGILGIGQTSFGVFDIPTVTESSIITSLEVIGEEDHRIRIFPNPLSSQSPLFIEITGDVFKEEPIKLEIYDALGRLVLRDENVSPEGQHEIYLDKLSTGIFQLVLKNTKVISNRSIVLKP